MQGKVGLLQVTRELMPEGKANYLQMVKYPQISELRKTVSDTLLRIMIGGLLIDFCGAFNVVRNMTEDQMLEAAYMLLDECGNFRLEDYAQMFAMAKRGQLVKIYDRIDLQTITAILDAYWIERNNTGNKAQEEEEKHLSGMGDITRQLENMNPQDSQLTRGTDSLAGAINSMKNQFKDWQNDGKAGSLDT